MNDALLRKTIGDAMLLFIALLLLMFSFPWIFAWASGMISLGAFSDFLTRALPPQWQRLWGVPISELTTPAGRLALVWVHPLMMIGALTWAIARGSDCVSGEIGRGSMEMLLAQPVRRTSIYVTHAAVSIAGSALLATAALCGTTLGLRTREMYADVSWIRFIAPAVNMFALMVCFGGLAAFASACDSQRWRTIGIMVGVYVVAVVLTIAGQVSPAWSWLQYFSVLTPYKPQTMVAHSDMAWQLLGERNGHAALGLGGCQLVLAGLGAASYLAGAVVFARREIPAPI